ncbi:MAG: hypothetical protein JNM17_00505, partial [Archangium sp.]|nr:hypothetical protein [Archangium sp.]
MLDRALAAELDVVVWGRRETGRRNARLLERTSVDFSAPHAVRDDLRDADAIVWCLGVAQAQVTPAQYEEIAFGYTMAVAREVAAHRPSLRFVFLSGGGADSTEKSRVRFARTKGRTENALFAMLSDFYCARP